MSGLGKAAAFQRGRIKPVDAPPARSAYDVIAWQHRRADPHLTWRRVSPPGLMRSEVGPIGAPPPLLHVVRDRAADRDDYLLGTGRRKPATVGGAASGRLGSLLIADPLIRVEHLGGQAAPTPWSPASGTKDPHIIFRVA